jgi:hypothetical protein
MVVVCWQAWRDIREETAVAVNTGCHDVGLRKQHLGYHDRWDCWHFTLRVCLLGTAMCWCWQSLLTFGRNLLPHILTPLNISTVAWCCRRTQDSLHDAESSRGALQHRGEVRKRVSSLPDIAEEIPAVCLLKITVLSHRRLCRGISHGHRFPHCAPAEHWCYTNCDTVSTAAIK